jgi:hypothetical protein
LGLLDHIPRIGATFVLAQHLSLSAHCCRSSPTQDAAVRPFIAYIRASCSIMSAGTSVCEQSGLAQMQLLLTQKTSKALHPSFGNAVHFIQADVQARQSQLFAQQSFASVCSNS